SSLNRSLYGQTVTFTDTVTSSAGGTPTGNVTFYDGTTLLGTVALNASGKATLATSGLMVGTHQISAGYAGAGSYQSSTSNTIAQVVNYTSTVSGSQNGGLTVGAGQAVNIASGGKANGGATVQAGGILYLNGGNVNGGITVQSGGSVYMNGGTVNG